MMDAKDKSAQDALNARVQAASTKLDSVLPAMAGSEAKMAAEFKAVWDQFGATRDSVQSDVFESFLGASGQCLESDLRALYSGLLL